MGSRLIIIFSIVRRVLCGMPFLPGFISAELRSYLLASGQVVIQGALLFGKWFIYVLCGVFGESVMIDILRTLQGLVRSSSIFFFLPFFSPGLRACLPCR
jgi:hypothetical protein